MTIALQLQGIGKSFDGFKALTDADFSAHWGEVHALLGKSGAGKSSLMNIAAGVYPVARTATQPQPFGRAPTLLVF